MHRHGSVRVVCETYGAQVLGITPEDRCLSAAKAFFAYGLGNSVLFPMSAGAAAVLEPSPARPEIMAERAGKHAATLFFAGPTFFSNMLRAGLPAAALAGVRLAASAGEALPAALYQRWTSHFGVDILDGIGMTEMLHIFLSNRPGQVRAGHDRDRGARLRPAGTRRGRAGGPARHPGDLVRPGRVGRDRVLVALRRLAPGVPGGVAAHRGHLRGGRGRVLRLPGAYRGHAQGQRHLGLARPRWSRGCWRTTTWPRPWWWPRTTPTGWKSRWPSSCSIPAAIGRRGHADRVLPDRPAVLQAASPDRVRDRVPDDVHRQDPPRRPARAGRVDHARRAWSLPPALWCRCDRDRPVRRPIAVIGAGTMGTGIAQVAAVAGHPVIVYDAVEGAAGRAVDRGRGTGSPGWSPRAASTAIRSDLRLEVATELGELAQARVRDRGGGRGPGRQAGPVRRPGEVRRAGLRAGHQHLLAVADRHRGRAQPPGAPGGPAFLQPGAGDAAGRGGQRPGHRPRRRGGRHQAGRRTGASRSSRRPRRPGSS